MEATARIDLVGLAEIQDLLFERYRERTTASFDVFRKRVTELRERRDDFPEPRAAIHLGEIWHRTDIEAWADEHDDELAAHLLNAG